MEEGNNHLSSQADLHEQVATNLEKPNLMAAWIAREEQSRGASSNKRRRPLGLPQLALDTTNCSALLMYCTLLRLLLTNLALDSQEKL
uniref:Uncharacterized protein n=1 Tax=Nymphaea colorata TaxID=210225 RepID=A0A5K0XVC7_9MAGN